MAKIVNGMIMGICMYGEITDNDIENFKDFMNSLEGLKKSLTNLFNADVAEMAMKNILKGTKVEVTDGEVEDAELWEKLVDMRVVYKKEDRRISPRIDLI